MTEETLIDGGLRSGLSLDNQDLHNLRSAAKWAKFLGIIGFVFTGLILLLAVGMTFFMGSLMSEAAGMTGAMSGGAFGLVYLIIGVPYFFISLFLYRFGSRTGQGVRSEEMNLLSQGFEQLNKYFTFTGILVAIVVGLYAILLVFMLIFGAAAAF